MDVHSSLPLSETPHAPCVSIHTVHCTIPMYCMYILRTKPHPPVIHGNQCAGELYLVLRAGALLSNDSGAFVDDVEQHLGELGVLVEVHQVWQAVVHLEGDTSSLQAANSKERGSLACQTFCFWVQ